MLSTIVAKMRRRLSKDETRLDSIETYCTNMSASIKSLKIQVSQLDNELKTQAKGKFPSDTKQKPGDHCMAITL